MAKLRKRPKGFVKCNAARVVRKGGKWILEVKRAKKRNPARKRKPAKRKSSKRKAPTRRRKTTTQKKRGRR